MSDPDEPTKFSGWWILGFSVMVGALTAPGQTIGVSVFIDHFEADLGLGRSAVSGAYLVGTLLGAMALPAIGRRIDSAGVRASMTWIAIAFVAALANMAGVQGLVWLAIGFTGIRMFGQGALSLVSRISVALWFDRRRGLAMGILIPAISALMALAPILLDASIGQWGWRTTWLIAAAVVAIVVLPIARFAMIDQPADVGQLPDGGAQGPAGTHIFKGPEATRRDAIRSPGFIVLAAVSATMSMLVTALNFHQIRLLGEAGLSSSEAAAMFLPQVLGATVVGLAFGVLSDHRIAPLLPALAMVWLGAALVLGATADGPVLVALYAITLGASLGSISTVSSTLIPRWFGVTNLASIQGVLTFVGVACSALGPLALSVGAAITGDYQTAALTFTTLPVVVGVAAVVFRPVETARSERAAPVSR